MNSVGITESSRGVRSASRTSARSGRDDRMAAAEARAVRAEGS